MKLTPVQKHLLSSALRDAAAVLRDVKLKPLKGKALEDMKDLESAVQTLECLNLP